MLVYSTRFIAANASTGASYTVPAGYAAVVRCVTVSPTAQSTSERAYLLLQPAGVLIVNAYINVGLVSAGWSPTILNLRLVANAGETLLAGGGADLYMTVSGYLLTLP